MRVLIVIAHYWHPKTRLGPVFHLVRKLPSARLRNYIDRLLPSHGSLAANPQGRIEALTACISSLHSLFGKAQVRLKRPERVLQTANAATGSDLKVIVCTHQDNHVLAKLPLPSAWFSQHASTSEPLYLSFECQAILGRHLGSYDYYCFLEDDLVLHDPSWFLKLHWFNQQAGPRRLLQPNRYEVSVHGPWEKFYIDDEFSAEITRAFQDISRNPELTFEWMGRPLAFHRTANPHSGCYFLNQEQLQLWTQQPHFARPDDAFVSPLETGASLGIMRTFDVYRPALPHANFLELEHYGSELLTRAGQQVPIGAAAETAISACR